MESANNTSKAASRELVYSLLGGSVLNYVGHRACIRKVSQTARRHKMCVDLGEVARLNELAGVQERNLLHRATRNGAWLSAVTHRLNVTELSWEEFRDNLPLRYGLMPQDIPATCNGCGKNFSIKHAQSCPKVGLVLAGHDDATKEWGVLGAWALVPSAIPYEHKINSRTVRGERNGTGARQEGGEANGGTESVGEAHGGRGRTVNGAARSVGKPRQVQVPAESKADVSAYGFWKRGSLQCLTLE